MFFNIHSLNWKYAVQVWVIIISRFQEFQSSTYLREVICLPSWSNNSRDKNTNIKRYRTHLFLRIFDYRDFDKYYTHSTQSVYLNTSLKYLYISRQIILRFDVYSKPTWKKLNTVFSPLGPEFNKTLFTNNALKIGRKIFFLIRPWY